MAPIDPTPPARPDAAYALRGLVPTGLTVLALVAVVIGTRAGTGATALLAAGVVVVVGLLVMVAIGDTVRRH